MKQIVEGIEKRAHNMPVNTNRSQQKNMNRSYTVDTGYTSGALHKTSLNSNHSFDALNQTMPTKLYSNFAQKFESTCQRRFPNSRVSTTTHKHFYNYPTNPVSNSHINRTSTNLNNSSLLGNKSESFILDSSVSNASNSSHYSSLFSR